jgi:hypothetical protein
MRLEPSLDALVRQSLRTWPQHPPGLADHGMAAGATWLRARPGNADDPYLKMPGTTRLRTIPDGLWLCFGGTERDAYVDIFCDRGLQQLSEPA